MAAGLGDHEQGRRLLIRVRQTFLDEANAFDAALDLAISYLQEGKTAEVRELADEMVTVFRDQEVSREPMAALSSSRRPPAAKPPPPNWPAKSPRRSVAPVQG